MQLRFLWVHLFLAFGWLIYLSNLLHASQGHADYLEYLQNKAARLQLYDDPQWKLLLHYHSPSFGTADKSAALGENFFLAREGKTNPQAELKATLEFFFRQKFIL